MDQTLHRGSLGVEIGTDPTATGLLLFDGHVRGMLLSSIAALLLGTTEKVHDGREDVGDLPLTVGAHFALFVTGTSFRMMAMATCASVNINLSRLPAGLTPALQRTKT